LIIYDQNVQVSDTTGDDTTIVAGIKIIFLHYFLYKTWLARYYRIMNNAGARQEV